MKAQKVVFINGIIIFFILITYFYTQVLKYIPIHNRSYICKTLYVDRNFNAEELNIIQQAAQEWEIKTNNMVKFDIIQMPTSEKINFVNTLVIIKVTEDYPEVLYLDDGNNKTTLGYYTSRGATPYIAIIDNRIVAADYKTVILHELGHSLGLQHDNSADGIGTLMYPTINASADEITEKDLQQFCTLYRCVPGVLKN